ncbi:MAG TPA: deoxyribonuclease IV, partial [Patescibacteria group bacterium]
MLFGSHVSIAGGLENAPTNASKVGCEVFQMFTRSPYGGKEQPITKAVAQKFKKACQEHGFKDYYVHAPYYINLASSNNRIRYGSISAIRKELERSDQLGVKYVMAHLGSAKDVGEKEAVKKTAEAIKKILTGYKGKTEFLMEMSAGSGQVIGDTFDELAEILKLTGKFKNKIGICFDTAHAFASGYDLRTKKAVDDTFKEFDKKIGLKKLKLIHCNDSKTGLGSHVDRHEHLGQGQIGLDGFKAIVKHSKLKKINIILETPK